MTNEAQKKWNVLVYQAGDNNLSGEMIWSLQEMAEVGARDEMHITAQFDPVGGPPKILEVNDPTAGFSPGHFPSLRKEMKDLDVDRIKDFIDKKQRALKKEPADAGGSVEHFETEKGEFLANEDPRTKVTPAMIETSACPVMIEAFLAEYAKGDSRNLLILSGHGSGAVGDFLRDSNPFSTLTIPELAGLLGRITNKIGKKIDILGMDSCNMSMIEVCYEVRESSEYLVGSEGYLLNCGWPYRRVLGQLKAKPGTGAKIAAADIVKQYTGFYSDYTVAGVSVDMSAIDLSQEKMSELTRKLTTLAEALRERLPKDKDLVRAVLTAHWQAQSYKDEEYVDLWDFCEQLRNHDIDLNTQLEQVQRAIDDAVTINCFSGPMFQHSHGLSIYLPWTAPDEVVDDYCLLSFCEESGWGEFVKVYLKETRREMRALRRTGEGEEQVPVLDESLFLIRRNPPYGKRNPPYGKRNPPYGKGLFFQPSRVKNFPDTYYPSHCKCETKKS